MEDRPWRPRIKTPPLFNPFEPSTQWTEQLGDGARIEIEDEEPTEESVPANPATEKTDDKGSAA